jgi:hypothetical protein
LVNLFHCLGIDIALAAAAAAAVVVTAVAALVVVVIFVPKSDVAG